MLNLIKMEWYKLRTTKLFWIMAAVVFAVNTAAGVALPAFTRAFSETHTAEPVLMSSAFANPFVLSLLTVTMFISAVSFMSADFSGGFIKNYAGQVKNKVGVVISKFIVIGIHNLIFFIVGAAAVLFGAAVSGTLVLDSNVPGGVATMLIKWLLSMAVCSILMLLSVGVRNKTLATIVGVVFATGALSLVYLGIDTAVANIFHISDFSLGSYLPDYLLGAVSVINNTLVVNGIAVSAVFIALFTVLTCIMFKKRDIK